MEWLVVVALALLAAVLIALPLRASRPSEAGAALEEDALIEERRVLLSELRELDEDAAAGRISSDDRLAGRRALAPRLREVTEALQRAGVETAPPR
jgi:hypothetical protein